MLANSYKYLRQKKINYFVILFFLSYSFFLPSRYIKVISYHIWKAESSFTGFGTQIYQSKFQI